jgi:hypothetical protein
MCACRRRSQSAIKIPFAVRKLQSGIKPYKTVESFQTQSHSTLSLLEALDDLNGILNSFTEGIGAPTDVDLSALRLPLLRCGNACTEFEEVVLKCLSRSGGKQTFKSGPT